MHLGWRDAAPERSLPKACIVDVVIIWKQLERSSLLQNFILAGVCQTQISRPCNPNGAHKGDLELQRHDTEIKDLNGRPQDVVGSQGRKIDILEFPTDIPFASPLCDSHEREEDTEANWSKDQLIHGDSL